jgi:DnaJ-domain-containing protein 1
MSSKMLSLAEMLESHYKEMEAIEAKDKRIAELESMLVSRTKEVDDGITRYNKSVSKQQKIIAELEEALATSFEFLSTSQTADYRFYEDHKHLIKEQEDD